MDYAISWRLSQGRSKGSVSGRVEICVIIKKTLFEALTRQHRNSIRYLSQVGYLWQRLLLRNIGCTKHME